jgi:formylglycine-generating enzyme required for sulfatase activity
MKKILGDYTVLEKIGEGSLGEVYLAEHRFIKRPFALKVIPKQLAGDPGFLQRFEKDLSAIATLDHPNIAKVHNISTADETYFIVSDHITDDFNRSMTLESYLQQQKSLSEEEVVQILSQVASALDYAHQRQMGNQSFVHRGLKLNNILIGKRDPGVHVYLTDFGLARVVGEGRMLSHLFSHMGIAMQKDQRGEIVDPLSDPILQAYNFLAPEQKVTGKNTFVSSKADIYAFGVLAYILLMHAYPEGFFPLPSKSEKGFKLNWDPLIMKCLQPSVASRPTTLAEMLREISRKEKPLMRESHGFAAPIATPYYEEPVATMAPPKPKLNPQEIKRPTYEEDPAAIFHLETTVARYIPEEKEVINLDPIQTEMVSIQGGEYARGNDLGARDERPAHHVFLSSFALDIHPVTNEQFVRFLEAMGGEKDANNNDILRLRESRIKRYGGKLQIESGYTRHPVVGVTWYGATAYAKWVGKRLPTEAEWEVASRSGMAEITYPTGSDIERNAANFFSSDTVNVMQFPPNPYNLYDMAGNVYEWCEDWYDYNYFESSQQEPDNPKGPVQGVYRVLRGGCWKSLKDDLRCSHRHRNNPGTVNRTYGFRCAADVE